MRYNNNILKNRQNKKGLNFKLEKENKLKHIICKHHAK